MPVRQKMAEHSCSAAEAEASGRGAKYKAEYVEVSRSVRRFGM